MLQEAESICRRGWGGEWWELLIIRWLWLWKLSITLSMWVSGDELVLTVINSFVPAKVFLVV